eukprot:1161905-Pelagomonas_calceolata.AAC.4
MHSEAACTLPLRASVPGKKGRHAKAAHTHCSSGHLCANKDLIPDSSTAPGATCTPQPHLCANKDQATGQIPDSSTAPGGTCTLRPRSHYPQVISAAVLMLSLLRTISTRSQEGQGNTPYIMHFT